MIPSDCQKAVGKFHTFFRFFVVHLKMGMGCWCVLLLFASVESFNLILLFFVCVGACACDKGGEEVSGQPCDFASLPPPFPGFWGLNSGLQLCVATASPTLCLCQQ